MGEHCQKISIHTEYIKLEQLCKLAGLVQTGGEAKERIAAGEAEVNGQICLERGRKLRPGDEVCIRGERFSVISAAREQGGSS